LIEVERCEDSELGFLKDEFFAGSGQLVDVGSKSFVLILPPWELTPGSMPHSEMRQKTYEWCLRHCFEPIEESFFSFSQIARTLCRFFLFSIYL